MTDDPDYFPSGRTIIVGIVLFILLSLVLDWVYAGQNFILYKFWAPKQEAVRRQIYENTKSYHQGSIQRLDTLCLQAKGAEDEVDTHHITMINDVINEEFSEWDLNDVPGYLKGCLVNARNGR